tara:strand:- start:194 stop:649 length:456 start_codon:yes stop_codon:yes gene_type:complete
MANYDSIDFWLDEDGDIDIGSNGDIKSTEEDYIRSFQQRTRSLLKSSTDDWSDHPRIASDLYAFIGQPNTRENASLMKRVIKRALVRAGTIRSEDLEVNINAAGLYSVYIEIIVNATPTVFNSVDGALTLGLFFDSTDGSILWGPSHRGGI